MGWAPAPRFPWLTTCCCCCCSHLVLRTASCHFRHRMAHLRWRRQENGNVNVNIYCKSVMLFNVSRNIYVNFSSTTARRIGYKECHQSNSQSVLVIYIYSTKRWISGLDRRRCLIWSEVAVVDRKFVIKQIAFEAVIMEHLQRLPPKHKFTCDRSRIVRSGGFSEWVILLNWSCWKMTIPITK